MDAPTEAPAPGQPGHGPAIPVQLHGTTVALNGRGVLITGHAGSGKSALALQIMAFGGVLVADDITCLWRAGRAVMADVPDAIRGRIEARGVGILHATPHGPAPLALWVDLDSTETERLPPDRRWSCLGVELPVLHDTGTRCFPAAILQYLKSGRDA